MARLFLVALLALVGCANAFTSPSAGVSRSAVTRTTPVEMIGKKSAAKPKKAAKKDDGFWANVCSAMHFVSLDAIARFARSRTRPLHTICAVDARTAARTPVESWHLLNQNLHEIHSRQLDLFIVCCPLTRACACALALAVRPRRLRHGRPRPRAPQPVRHATKPGPFSVAVAALLCILLLMFMTPPA